MAAPADDTSTVCGITRTGLKNARFCSCPDPKLPQCNNNGVAVQASPACGIFKLAELRDRLTQWQYAPAGLVSRDARLARRGELVAVQRDILSAAAKLEGTYGATVSTNNVAYWRMQRCLTNADGTKNAYGEKYVQRNTIRAAAGYSPLPLVGGTFLEGRLPTPLTELVPIWCDTIMNPSLMVVFIFVLLVVLFAVLMIRAERSSRAERGSKANGPRTRWHSRSRK